MRFRLEGATTLSERTTPHRPRRLWVAEEKKSCTAPVDSSIISPLRYHSHKKALIPIMLFLSRRNQRRKINIKREGSCYPVNQCPELKLKPIRRGNEIAVVACGSFWNPQIRFQKMKGIKRVLVGYSGGQQRDPSYKNIYDHTEALFIEYNPKKVSFREILQMWRDNDYPWEPETLRHRSAIFPTTESQVEEAVKFVAHLSKTKPQCKLYVAIEQCQRFYRAEDFHQDYITKQVIAAKKHLIAWANNQVPTGLFTITE